MRTRSRLSIAMIRRGSRRPGTPSRTPGRSRNLVRERFTSGCVPRAWMRRVRAPGLQKGALLRTLVRGGTIDVVSLQKTTQRTPVPYDVAAAAQRTLADRRRESSVPDLLWLLEHPPTITW